MQTSRQADEHWWTDDRPSILLFFSISFSSLSYSSFSPSSTTTTLTTLQYIFIPFNSFHGNGKKLLPGKSNLYDLHKSTVSFSWCSDFTSSRYRNYRFILCSVIECLDKYVCIAMRDAICPTEENKLYFCFVSFSSHMIEWFACWYQTLQSAKLIYILFIFFLYFLYFVYFVWYFSGGQRIDFVSVSNCVKYGIISVLFGRNIFYCVKYWSKQTELWKSICLLTARRSFDSNGNWFFHIGLA